MRAIDRFLEKTELDGDCLRWTAGVIKGYGNFSYNGKPLAAHRASYALFVGPLDGRYVCHRCDNTWCVHPGHLFLGTQSENMLDAKSKGRLNSHKRNGTGNGRAVLTEGCVLTIRERLTAGEHPTKIAYEYGVTAGNIRMIQTRRTWSHL